MGETRISGPVVIGILVVLVIGFFIFFSLGAKSKQVQPTPGTGVPGTLPSTGAAVVAGCSQQTDGTNTINSAFRNDLNSSLSYEAASFAVEYDDGGAGPTGTGTAGTSLTNTGLNAAPCKTGTLYVLGSTTIGSTAMPVHSFELTKGYAVAGAKTDVVTWIIRDTSLSNLSSTTASQNANTEGADESIADGDSKTYYIDGQLKSGSKAFGYTIPTKDGNPLPSDGSEGTPDGISVPSDGVLYAVDISTNKFSKASGFVLAGPSTNVLTKLSACPNDAELLYSGIDICYTGKTLVSGDGMLRHTITVNADLGEPGTADDIQIRVLDKVYFRDAGGKIVLGFVNAAGTDQGAGNSAININVS